MRKNIVNTISSYRKITNVVIISHNIDFMYLQSVVVSSLRKAGNPRLLVIGDSDCVYESFERQRAFLDGLGVRYRVIPVKMSPGFRFHPKMILACGEESGHLIVGSGNITFGGWGENGEIWSEFSATDPMSGNLTVVREFVESVVRGHQAEDHIRDFLSEGFADDRLWVSKLSKESNLIIKYKGRKSLLEQIKNKLGRDRYDELHVFSPFYDKEGRAIHEFAESFQVSKVKVNAPHIKSNMSTKLVEFLDKKKQLSSSKFITGEGEELKARFVHAKVYALIEKDSVDLILGSANCSNAALLSGGELGNCEAVVWCRVSLTDYSETILNEVVVTDEIPEITDSSEEIDIDQNQDLVPAWILGASLEAGKLIVAFEKLEGASVEAIFIDDEKSVCKMQVSPLVLPLSNLPSSVRLQLSYGGKMVLTAAHWVDHEGALAASVGAISFSSQIKDNVDLKKWGLESYAEIVRAFNDNIKVLPKFSKARVRVGENQKSELNLSFSEDEIFADKNVFSKLSFNDISPNGDRVFGLGSLILNWFGINSAGSSSNGGGSGNGESRNDEIVDLEEKPSFKNKKIEVEKIRKKISKQISGISEKFRDKSYFESRSPERFVADIKIASVLLRVGLREGWVSKEDFYKITSGIWSVLFFSCQLDEATGWIDYYMNQTAEKVSTIARMRSVELTVAMSLWAHGLETNDTPEFASFRLASYLSVARHPWIWQGGEIDNIAKEISKAVILTDDLTEAGFDDFKKEFSEQWFSFMQKGLGLRKLEDILNKYSVKELAEKVNVKDVENGDLLWQGKLGFAVCDERQKVTPGCKVKVRTPQTSEAERVIMGDLLVPLKGVIREDVLPEWGALDDRWKQAIASLVDDLTCLKIQRL